MVTKAVREINTRLRALADEDKAAFAKRFFKAVPGGYGEGDHFLGIRVPGLRRLSREYEHIGVDDATALLQSKYHETRLLALFILTLIFERGDDKTRRTVYDLYLANIDRINNWDLVDLSAYKIVGAYLFERSKRPLYRLAKSKDLWERRIAMIATYHFIRHGEFDDALAIAERLRDDHHDLIHRAVGWMLREIGNRDRASEEAFLKRHYRGMPRTMLRYAIEKFPQRRRKQYLTGKV